MDHVHHRIPVSRGGPNDSWNLVTLDPIDHAFEHALDFVLFESAPWFDCRQSGWKKLPRDLQQAVRKEQSERRKQQFASGFNPRWICDQGKWSASQRRAQLVSQNLPSTRLKKSLAISKAMSREEVKMKLKQRKNPQKGKVWVNNGLESMMVFPDCIPDGFEKGRLPWREMA